MPGDNVMLDRRQTTRSRVFYGGRIAFNARNSTMDCLVRNFSDAGAKVEFENSALLPDEIDFTIPRKAHSWVARIVWRRENQAGVAFGLPKQPGPKIPLDLALRLRAGERARKDLLRRIEELRSER
jgi:hypothetical protein